MPALQRCVMASRRPLMHWASTSTSWAANPARLKRPFGIRPRASGKLFQDGEEIRVRRPIDAFRRRTGEPEREDFNEEAIMQLATQFE